jgi:hypothetical protein
MEQKPLYKDPFHTEVIKHEFIKETIANENQNKFKSYVHGLDLQKIRQIPLVNEQIYDMPQQFR